MENDKKEESVIRSYTLSSNNLSSKLEKAIKVFEKNLEVLDNLIKLLKSDMSNRYYRILLILIF